METLASGSDTRKIKLRLEGLLWKIKRAETKRATLKKRAARVQKRIADSTVVLINLADETRRTIEELNAAGWDRAVFEARTGLKLPD
jgi:hypothetical protein